jgi:hypothetical protein
MCPGLRAAFPAQPLVQRLPTQMAMEAVALVKKHKQRAGAGKQADLSAGCAVLLVGVVNWISSEWPSMGLVYLQRMAFSAT